MSNLLQGKKGLILGALDSKSIAWIVAEMCFNEGAEIVLSNAPIALRKGDIQELAAKCNNCPVIAADITSLEDIEALLKSTKEHFAGGIDFILHSVGMSLNIRKKRDYTNLDYEYMKTSIDISAISFHKLLQVAYNLDVLNQEASVLALSYIAAQRVFPNYSEMAEAKAMLESIARSWGYHYGKKRDVRINTISQSPTLTTAGSGIQGFDAFFNYAEKMSPLGNASAQDCAKYCITLFSDYTKKITMQNLYSDGGFSSVGISDKIIDCIS
ncbi:MAG: enoyl-ACP reductase FabI [Solitalea-like symbiont of Tyrophagus putrescentiae]